MATKFSQNLSVLRQEREISQRTAAKDLGVSQALLSHYENGIREPGLPFVVRACDYYHVSADFLLGRTLAREGNMLTSDEILNAADEGKVLQGSVLATLQSKLISGAIGVLFGLLGKMGDKKSINAAAACLGDQVYALYRQLYHVSGENDSYFAVKDTALAAPLAGSDGKLMEARFIQTLNQAKEEKKVFPDLSAEALEQAYPGRCQSLTQVLSTADARIYNLQERE